MTNIVPRLRYEVSRRLVGPALVKAQTLQSRWRAFRRQPDPDRPLGPPLESGRALKELMSLRYFSNRYVEGAHPVAWVTSGAPVEVLRAFGFVTFYPEQHGAICGVQRLVPEITSAAEDYGFSRDLCSYARTDFGSVLSGKTPLGRIPRPNLLLACTNICQTVLLWYRFLSNYLNVPLVVIDTPFNYGEVQPHQLDYIKDQLIDVMKLCGRLTNQPYRQDRLRKILLDSREAALLWGECLEQGAHHPSPWTGFDGFIHMAPIVSMRGLPEAVSYYRLLRDELKERIRRSIGGIRQEKYRLLWDNLPIWHRMRDLGETLARNHFNVVITTYTNAWAESARHLANEDDPLEGLAQAYTRIILNQDLSHRYDLMKRLAKQYQCQGVIFHSDRSCKPYSTGQYDLSRRFSEEGLRSVVLESDHSDQRADSAEQMETRLAAFMEGFET